MKSYKFARSKKKSGNGFAILVKQTSFSNLLNYMCSVSDKNKTIRSLYKSY